jgi:acyl transferase domain-containing protein/phosphopantetheinyl transferase
MKKEPLHMPGAHHNNDAIAIIGMACVFPQAPDMETYWRNILGKVDAISEPLPAWDADRYLKSGRISTSHGGYLKDLYRFDPREFGIMPNSIDGGEPDQFLALRVARDALLDAGYTGDAYDHRDTGIVLGHSSYLHRGQGTVIQNHTVLDQTMELLHVVCPLLGGDKLAEIRQLLEKKLPQSNADTAPSLVPNVMTGRIANRLNFKGPNYLVDAACSSSLLAVNAAVDELRNGRSRMMLAGGVNASLPAEVAVIFTQLGALSKRGKVRPFEAGSDGTLLGEGLGMVVLKRMADAIKDGDRVYALIRGIGQASDGKGQGLLAPSVEGETLAVGRAYAASGVDPASISLIEAHGTGIPLGDKTEIAALRNVFGGRRGAQGNVAIGSVKSMISHCIPAAGIAGMIKVALALHHKILPPTLCETVNPELGLDDTPFYINTEMRPWLSPTDAPRRAGVDSFGFGGINTHAILEEAPRQAAKPQKLSAWPAELSVFSADSAEALLEKLAAFADVVGKNGKRPLADFAATLAAQQTHGDHRIAIIAETADDLAKKIAQSIKRLNDNKDERWATRNGIFYCARPLDGGLAFLFPGEGSQYQGMFAELAQNFDEVRTWFDFWRGLYNDPDDVSRTDYVFPPAQGLSPQRRAEMEQRLHDMDVGSEAVFIGGQAMFALLTSLGVHPDVMVGHSSGESSALAASGAIASGKPQQLAEFIRELNKIYRQILQDGKIPTGALLTVGALAQAEVEKHIAEMGREVLVAMDNCANQLVLFGDEDSIKPLQDVLARAGGICQILPFNRGYHTPLFAGVSAAFHGYYDSIGVQAPQIPLYSCVTAGVFPKKGKQVRELAAAQWSSKVRFRETVAKMHQDGIRYFVEVGPSGNLSAFVNSILAGKEYVSVASNLRRRDGIEQVLTVLAHLFVNQKYSRLDRLFESRRVQPVDLANIAPPKSAGMLLDNTMPMLRLGDADRTALLKITAAVNPNGNGKCAAPDNETCHARNPRYALPLSSSLPQAGESDRVSLREFHVNSYDTQRQPEMREPAPVSGHGAGVMADYFGVMRSFLEQQGRVLEHWADNLDTRQDEYSTARSRTPFLGAIREQDERHLLAECRLSVYEDNFLRDHILSGAVSGNDPGLLGLACIPLMVSLEIMAEACAVLAGADTVCAIENVKAFDWIALDDGELVLEVRAERLDAENPSYRAQVLNAGVVTVSADFLFTPEWRLGALPELAEQREYRWNEDELYSTGMFHGPIFQSIRRVEGWSGEGIDAQLSGVGLDGFFDAGATPQMVLNPVLLDAFGQLAAYWIAQQVGTDFNSFPSTIGRIELYEDCPQNISGLVLRARQHPLDPADANIAAPRSWQFECADSQGHVLARASNLVNIYFPVPNRFYQVRRDPLRGSLGHAREIAGKHGVTLWQLPQLADDFCAQSGGIFLRILAQAILGGVERDEWRQLSASANRRREWLLGRACIKEAVRHWVMRETGHMLYPTDIIVLHDDRGAPHVDGWWNGTVAEPPEVSLSHDRRMALAAVAPPRHPVGVDVEEAGRIRQPELVKEAFTPTEQSLLHGLDGDAMHDRLLRIWCAKEAAAKYFKVGLQGNPALFEVSFAGGNWEWAQVMYAGTAVGVALNREGDSIVALAN